MFDFIMGLQLANSYQNLYRGADINFILYLLRLLDSLF